MNPYSYADKVIRQLRESINIDMGNTLNAMSFDELNVVQTQGITKELYRTLNRKAKQAVRRVMKRAYRDAYLEVTGTSVDDDELLEAAYLGLLNGFHPVTKYQYTSEVLRKRDRLTEAVLAVESSASGVNAVRQGVRDAFGTAGRFWDRQATQYIDFGVDTGRTAGFKRAGVLEVIWHSQSDDRVCPDCWERDEQVYPIDDIPPKPHPRCRCWWSPVIRK